MVSFSVDSKKYKIKSVSELTFAEFNKIFVLSKVCDLREYISVLTEIDVKTLMGSKLDGAGIETLHYMLFNIDIEKTIKEKKKTLTIDDKIFICDELDLSTFGHAYYFDLYLQKYNAKLINEYELFIYGLAVATCENLETDIQKNYNKLISLPWVDVLPQGFFLGKKYKSKSRNLMRLFQVCTLFQKKISLLIKLQKHKLISTQKS